MTSPRSRAATVPLVGGDPVLDLVNTVSWRGAPERSEDHLRDPDDCLVWLVRADVLTHAEADGLRRLVASRPRAGAVLVRELRELRDVAVGALLAPQPATLAAASRAVANALRRAVLVGDHGVYRWTTTGLDEHTPRARLVLRLHELLLARPAPRIGVCADEQCQWAFVDTSRAGNRRWCDTRDCGNRHRVRAHHQRHVRGSDG